MRNSVAARRKLPARRNGSRLTDALAAVDQKFQGADEVSSFIPLHDRVLVRRGEEIETTQGGIVLPDNAKEKPLQGEVEAVGDGRWENGKRIPIPVKKGDRVVFSKYAGNEIRIDEQDFVVLRESEILGIVDGEVKQVAAA